MQRPSGCAVLAAALAVSFLAAVPAAAEWVDWIAEGDLGFEYDSNLNNAGFGSQEEYDVTWLSEVRLGRAYQLPGSTRFQALAAVRGAVHQRWADLDAVRGEGQLSLFHKFGLGDAPFARAFLDGGYEKVADGERSGWRLAVGGQAGKRFTPRFDAALTYTFSARDGDTGANVGTSMGPGGPGGPPGPIAPIPVGVRRDVFDQQVHAVVIDGRYLVTERLLATVGYEFRHGDLYSNARKNLGVVLQKAKVKAIAVDTVYGGWSYRMRGIVHSPFVRLNYGISDRWSIDAGYRYRYADSGALDYENQITELKVLFRY